MLVHEVMTPKVYTVNTNDTFEKVLNFLVSKRISGAVVLGKHKKISGVISEKDLLHNLFPSQKEYYGDRQYYLNLDRVENEAKRFRKLKVKELMTREVISVEPEDHVLKACSLLLVHHIRRLPVIKKGKLLGLVTNKDLYKNYLANVCL